MYLCKYFPFVDNRTVVVVVVINPFVRNIVTTLYHAFYGRVIVGVRVYDNSNRVRFIFQYFVISYKIQRGEILYQNL